MNYNIDDGYIILKNVLTKQQLEHGLSSDNNSKINYKIMKDFIDNDFMPTIQSNVSFMEKPNYVKFRYSNNNNSRDAATFHSDVYNYTSNEVMPIYTCLCYFDNTKLEIIPGSHKNDFHKNSSAISSYFSKKVIEIHPGDILIFHSNLYHRGLNFDKKGDRRLLQVFDVFPNEKIFNECYDKFVTVITSNGMTLKALTNSLYVVSKVPVIVDSFNFFHYILVYNDLQYKIIGSDIAPWYKNNNYVTYEASKRFNYDSITGSDPINMNIICKESIVREPDYFYLLVLLILVILIIYLVLLFKNNSNDKIMRNIRSNKLIRNIRSNIRRVNNRR